MAYTTRRIGVVLFQLGGPDTLEAIEPFLFNLFCDPDIIDFPFARIGRKPLAKLISSTRARKVQHHYATIGGGSPIRRFTEQQARALQLKLAESGLDARCFVAMRYWHPFTAQAIAQLQDAAMRRSRAASSLPAVFEHDDGQQPERMATAVPRRRARCNPLTPSIVTSFICRRWLRKSMRRWHDSPTLRSRKLFSARTASRSP